MEITQREMSYTDVIIAMKCNMCGVQYTNQIDWQNMLSVHLHQGYGSIIGDGAKVSFDMCEPCLKLIMNSFKFPATITDGELI